MICKIYGITDLIAALVIFFSLYSIPSFIKTVIIIIMLVKGIPSLFADLICKIYGIIDIIIALLIWLGPLPIPDFIKILLTVILFFKGIPSLFAH